jgi:NAD(P)-dependent dehydrogenase (short-subunit alcohol dehydrogenase family)
MLLSFRVNALGPTLVAQALLPLLQAARRHGSSSAERPAVIAQMSARVGSIGDNRLGGWYSYRTRRVAKLVFSCVGHAVAQALLPLLQSAQADWQQQQQ